MIPHGLSREEHLAAVRANLHNQSEMSIIIAASHYKPLFKQPKNSRAFCHCCNIGFKSIDAMQEHNKTPLHNRNKEKYLAVTY